MSGRKEKLAFWLMPAGDAKAFFTSVISDLARRLDAPVFEPHVTLRGADLGQHEAVDLLDRIANSRAALELEVSGVEFSKNYTKTLYVQFRSSAEATAMSDAIAKDIGSSGGYDFDPHLSLLYKKMSEVEKEELAREIQIGFAQVRFDSVKLVSVPTSIKAPEDVHAWRTIAERPLAGRSA